MDRKLPEFSGFFTSTQQLALYQADPTMTQMEMDEYILSEIASKKSNKQYNKHPSASIGYSSSDHSHYHSNNVMFCIHIYV